MSGFSRLFVTFSTIDSVLFVTLHHVVDCYLWILESSKREIGIRVLTALYVHLISHEWSGGFWCVE